MKFVLPFALFAVVLVAAPLAQPRGQSAAPPPQTDPSLPRGQMPTLGRSTDGTTDAVPLFDFDYFVGKWTFEWEVPDSPLGPGGMITGTTTYKKIDDGSFEGETDANGPGGAFKIRERILYHKDGKAVARQVTDSRGFSYMQVGPVGGDLGGEYFIYFVSEPFTYKGKTVRIRNSYRMQSPLNYKAAATLSVDGGRFVNYGNPWWHKQTPAGK